MVPWPLSHDGGKWPGADGLKRVEALLLALGLKRLLLGAPRTHVHCSA
jgi:hypothetical protein